MSNAGKFPWSWLVSCGLHSSLERERKFRRSLFASSKKREIRHFHVVVTQWRQRNVQKSVMHVQSCCIAHQAYCFFDVLAAVAVVVAKAPFFICHTAEKICRKVMFYLIIFFPDQKRDMTSSVSRLKRFKWFSSFFKYLFCLKLASFFCFFLNNSLHCIVSE